MRAAYAKSDNPIAVSYSAWPRYSTRPYQSATHGGRFVQNYANQKGQAYGRFEQAGVMPKGTSLVKDSFLVQGNGQVAVGPLFLMEKMDVGFNAASDDWRYTLIMPNGTTVGTTNGNGSASVQFCIECHKALSETDSMLFIPEQFRGG